MRIRNWKNETAEGLVAKVEKQAKVGFNPLKASYVETVDLARQYMTQAVAVMEEYVTRPYKSTMKAAQEGLCEEVSIARSKVVRAFKVVSTENMYRMTDAWIPQHEGYIYNLIETVFDMSLLVEQGLRSSFMQDYELQRSIVEVGYRKYVGYYNGRVLLIDTDEGEVYRVATIYKEDIKLDIDKKQGKVEVVLESGERVTVLNIWHQVGKWISMTEEQKGIKREKGKVYRRIQLSTTAEDKYGKGYYINIHHLVAMCAWGYDISKHCRGFASLLTVDHLDGDTLNNSIDNLALLTRVDNTKIGADGIGFDWVEFFKRVERDRINCTDKGYKQHYESLKDSYSK